jgi:hydrogenase maturation protease
MTGTSAQRVIVIGVGNTYRHDDGVGPAVVARLAEQGLPGAEVATSLGDTTELIESWQDAELAVVVDAVRADPAHPGRVHRLSVLNPGTERARAASSHGMDLGEAVELARELGRLPGRLILLAVEVADVSHGTGLTSPVRAAVDPLADEIRAIVSAHQLAQAT